MKRMSASAVWLNAFGGPKRQAPRTHTTNDRVEVIFDNEQSRYVGLEVGLEVMRDRKGRKKKDYTQTRTNMWKE